MSIGYFHETSFEGNPILPEWFNSKHGPAKEYMKHYKAALREWGYLFRDICRLQGSWPGEIDRCFWTALGKRSFLHKIPSRFKSYAILDHKGHAQSPNVVTLLDTPSQCGTDLVVTKIEQE